MLHTSVVVITCVWNLQQTFSPLRGVDTDYTGTTSKTQTVVLDVGAGMLWLERQMYASNDFIAPVTILHAGVRRHLIR